MGFIGNTIVSWVDAQPTIIGDISFGPGMSGTFAAHVGTMVRADITAYITRRNAHKSQHQGQNMGKVLANTGFQLPYLIHRGFYRSYSFNVLEVFVNMPRKAQQI